MAFLNFAVALVVFGFGAGARAELIPGSAPSEVAGFQAEWCAGVASAEINKICFGSMRFLGDARVRGLRAWLKNGAVETYSEGELNPVDLLQPDFEVVGPLEGEMTAASEIARVHLSYTSRGEVSSLLFESSRFGVVRVNR